MLPPQKNKRTYGAAEEPTKRRMGFPTRRNLVFAAVLGAALVAAAPAALALAMFALAWVRPADNLSSLACYPVLYIKRKFVYFK